MLATGAGHIGGVKVVGSRCGRVISRLVTIHNGGETRGNEPAAYDLLPPVFDRPPEKGVK
jgi:hypothetical protein